MCQPIVCAKMKWKPQIFPDWRPPRQGWQIATMPDIAPPQIRAAWKTRRVMSNKNGVAALQEMVDFLRINKIAVTKEMLAVMQDQADSEWCGAEPSRCPRTAKASGGALVREAVAAEKNVVAKAVRKSQGFVTQSRPRARRCCGG